MSCLCLQIRLLREILEWGQGIRTGNDGLRGDQPDPLTVNKVVQSALRKESEGSGDIIVAVFPEGTLERLPNGTTVAKVIRDKVGKCARSSSRLTFLSTACTSPTCSSLTKSVNAQLV